jgi:hypothetical protein
VMFRLPWRFPRAAQGAGLGRGWVIVELEPCHYLKSGGGELVKETFDLRGRRSLSSPLKGGRETEDTLDECCVSETP